jgi:hypothetical protein
MKGIGFLLGKATNSPPRRVPTDRMARIVGPVQSRLDDGLSDVFRRACAAGDLDAAADLLRLLETWHGRRGRVDARDEHAHAARLKRFRDELARGRLELEIISTRPRALAAYDGPPSSG